MLDVDSLAWEEPPGLGIRATEREYLGAERRRVVYVAATRARDLLVIPRAGGVSRGACVCGDLLADAPEDLTRTMEQYVVGREPAWALLPEPPERTVTGDVEDLERRAAGVWEEASRDATRPRFRPASVSGAGVAQAVREAEGAAEALPSMRREGRYGGIFGSTVHLAIGLVLRHDDLAVQAAVRRVAGWYGLQEHIEDAAADVARALEALRAAGIARPPGGDLQLEYPIAGALEGGLLASGYIDLVAVARGCVYVIDFKTDAPPQGPVEHAYPEYAGQVRLYGRLLQQCGVVQDRELRCGLLFTADGDIRWVEA